MIVWLLREIGPIGFQGWMLPAIVGSALLVWLHWQQPSATKIALGGDDFGGGVPECATRWREAPDDVNPFDQTCDRAKVRRLR